MSSTRNKGGDIIFRLIAEGPRVKAVPILHLAHGCCICIFTVTFRMVSSNIVVRVCQVSQP